MEYKSYIDLFCLCFYVKVKAMYGILFAVSYLVKRLQ